MDVLENGPERPPLGRRAKVLIGVLAGAAALLAGALLYPRPAEVAPAASSSPAPSSPASSPARQRIKGEPEPEPVLAGPHVQVGTAYSVDTDGRDFVLSFDLYDHDGSQPYVTAYEPPKHPGFARLAVAVVPGSSTLKSYADVTAAGGEQAALDIGSPGRLYLAGGSTCPADPAPLADVTLRINGELATIGLPVVAGRDWATAVTAMVCG